MEAGSSVPQHTPFKLQRGLAYILMRSVLWWVPPSEDTWDTCHISRKLDNGHVQLVGGKRSWTLGGTSNLAKQFLVNERPTKRWIDMTVPLWDPLGAFFSSFSFFFCLNDRLWVACILVELGGI